MPHFLKLINVFLLATVKYFYTPLYALVIGLSFFESLLAMVSGGVFGFLVFYYFSGFMISSFQRITASSHLNPRFRLRKKYYRWVLKRKEKRKSRKKFTRRNKMIIKTRSVYGMWGIILLTPILLSIPLGAFLLRKYYHSNKAALPIMLVTIVVEGVILCFVYWMVYDLTI